MGPFHCFSLFHRSEYPVMGPRNADGESSLTALPGISPFTDKIYSSAASKKSDSAPSTPRKSTRLAGKRSAEKLHSGSGSYAQAAAEPPASNGLPSTAPAPVQPLPAQTPRTRRRLQTVQSEEAASPARMTRSRSKGRVSSDME
jgi:hypothetical protein